MRLDGGGCALHRESISLLLLLLLVYLFVLSIFLFLFPLFFLFFLSLHIAPFDSGRLDYDGSALPTQEIDLSSTSSSPLLAARARAEKRNDRQLQRAIFVAITRDELADSLLSFPSPIFVFARANTNATRTRARTRTQHTHKRDCTHVYSLAHAVPVSRPRLLCRTSPFRGGRCCCVRRA